MHACGLVLGTWGDTQPYIALGREFVRRGHRFTMAAFPEFERAVLDAGLEYGRVSGSARSFLEVFLESGIGPLDMMRRLRGLYESSGRRLFDELRRVAKGKDVIVYTTFGQLVRHVAEAEGIPLVRTSVAPDVPSRLYCQWNPERPSARVRNSLMTRLATTSMDCVMLSTAKRWRKELGLSPWHAWSRYDRIGGKPVPVVFQFGESLVPRDPAWKDHVHLSGDWYAALRDEAPPPGDVADFVESGSPPVVVSFGSMLGPRVGALHGLLRTALERLGLRGVFVGADPGRRGAEDGRFCHAGFVPYRWLLPRSAGVVHHGGLGTVVSAVGAEVPSLVVAFGGDQQFWGHRVHSLGLGPRYVDQARDPLTHSLFVRRVAELVGGDFSESLRRVAAGVAAEDGPGRACDVIVGEASARARRGAGRPPEI